jgi:acyl dehydratase
MSDTPESLLTPDLLSWIGRTTERRSLGAMSESDIRRYSHATGDFNPLWLDDEFARAAGYRGRLVPPLLVGWVPFSLKEGEYAIETFDLRRSLPLPSHYTNVRNAGTEIEWLQPVYLGEEITVQTQLVDIVARQGRAGLGVYITQEEQVLNPAGDVVARRRSTVVLFPEARLETPAEATA